MLNLNPQSDHFQTQTEANKLGGLLLFSGI